MSTAINIRTPLLLPDGRINCEIEHPLHGWIPFTASATDCEQHGREIHAAAVLMNPPNAPQPE